MSASVFKGMMPALMTPCLPDRTPDFDALVRKGKEMMEAGMSAVIYAGSMGDWPLLTDAQRMEGVERLVAAGIPVVVGTGAINSDEFSAQTVAYESDFDLKTSLQFSFKFLMETWLKKHWYGRQC